VLPPGADVAMSHQCQLMLVATANKGAGRRDSHHGQATARMLCLSSHDGSVSKMLERDGLGWLSG
jgi:hypothetical protein